MRMLGEEGPLPKEEPRDGCWRQAEGLTMEAVIQDPFD